MLLTGMRDGLDSYAQTLAQGRPVLFVRVQASEDAKRQRGWKPHEEIDQSSGETCVDSLPMDFWDLTFDNHAQNTVSMTRAWVQHTLAPYVLKACIRDLSHTPIPGMVYRDLIGGFLLQPFGLPLCTALLIQALTQDKQETKEEQPIANSSIGFDAILAPEALGFLFAGPIANHFQVPIVCARKGGRLV